MDALAQTRFVPTETHVGGGASWDVLGIRVAPISSCIHSEARFSEGDWILETLCCAPQKSQESTVNPRLPCCLQETAVGGMVLRGVARGVSPWGPAPQRCFLAAKV